MSRQRTKIRIWSFRGSVKYEGSLGELLSFLKNLDRLEKNDDDDAEGEGGKESLDCLFDKFVLVFEVFVGPFSVDLGWFNLVSS